jgi:predicted TIM-barrel fold metal-dependent hydrolase
MKSFTYAVILGLTLLLQRCPPDAATAGVSGQAGKEGTDTFYTTEDFASVRKFDIHIHMNIADTSFIQLSGINNFQFLDIVDDRPFGVPMGKQQEIAILLLDKNPGQMRFATTFPVDDWDSPDWVDSTITRLKRSFKSGATAVKIWKNIGMDLRDEEGNFVMVDHPRLGIVLKFLEDNRIPLIGHNGEPRDCWLPLDEMTFSKGYYSAHPEYHMYLHPEYPSYEDQINARDHMLEKHPDLQFMGAHLGSLEWSLEALAERLDAYPNMRVDLTRMPNLKLHTLTDRNKTRDFFLKYQDRLIYGTDTAVNPTDNWMERNENIREGWLRDWEFFVTDNDILLPGFGQLKGLKLPRTVVDKIYFDNAIAFLNPIPV